jgi:hypothetical protein
MSAGRALALESADAVDAGAAVLARTRGALVDVDAAVGAGEPLGALAAVPVDAVDALAAVVARHRVAVIRVLFAAAPLEAVLADAVEASAVRVDARGAVFAWVRLACLRLGCTKSHGKFTINILFANRAKFNSKY